jgi:hypothetical protein
MIGGVEKMERRVGEFGDRRFQEVEFAECVARAAEEKHRDRDAGEVLGAFGASFTGRMKWKCEEY